MCQKSSPWQIWQGLPTINQINQSNQIKSNQIKSNQIKSNQVKSSQIKSNQINQSINQRSIKNRQMWKLPPKKAAQDSHLPLDQPKYCHHIDRQIAQFSLNHLEWKYIVRF